MVRDFRESVSSAVYQLAGYLSAAPLTLPVMRLVQESMMPETGSAELVEVFLSGLLRRSADDPAADAENALYVFAAGVRNVLQSTLTRGEALSVLDQVGSYMVKRRPGGRPFSVVLQGQPAYSDIQAAAEQFPTFGRIAVPLLERIAGPYADAIRHEATSTATASEGSRDGRPTGPVDFVNRVRELDEVVRNGVASPDGEPFWLLLAPPQYGKTWLLRKIADEVPRTRPGWWSVTWVDVREMPSETAANADAVLRMMVGQPPEIAAPVDAAGIADSMIDKNIYHLCLLDSAELLDGGTVYLLRQHLDAINREIASRRPDARLAVIAASRRDREWTGLKPARPPRIKRLATFNVDVATEMLANLAHRTNRRMTFELRQHAVRMHRQSEGLPWLLNECLQWTAGHWGELHLLDDLDIFPAIAWPYVYDVLLSPSSLHGSGPMLTDRQMEAMRDAFRVLCVFRLFTASHLSGPANRGELLDARTQAGWSADDVWNAVIGANLVHRAEKGAPMTIDRPIARLLFRYWYPSEDSRGQANREARDFLWSFTAKLSGSLAADMLIECLWHEAQASLLLKQSANLEASLINLAGRLSKSLRPDGAYTVTYLRGYTAETLEKDQELWDVLRDSPGLSSGLFDRVVEAVLRPEPEHS